MKTVAESADAVKLRREIVLHKAAKRMGKTSTVLEREMRAAGFVVMGAGKSRTVFANDLVTLQSQREGEGRGAVQQDDLTKDYVQGRADAELDALLNDCRKLGRSR